MKPVFRWYDALVTLIFFYLLVLQIQEIWPFTVDDMYISLRYAKNWAGGNGLLWNINEPPVEGYSNFSFVALAALTLLLKGNPVFVLKIAGIVGLIFSCIFTYCITRFWFERRASLIPCIALLLYKGEIIWAVSGLETAVYQALICGSVYFLFKGMGYNAYPVLRSKAQPQFFIAAGVLLVLAGMTRPETPALMVLFVLLLCWDKPRIYKKEYWRGVLYFILSLSLIFLPYFLWRWQYYGYLLPNSVYCKGFTQHRYVIDLNYLKLILPFGLFAAFACWDKPDKRYYFLCLPSVLYLVILMNADPVVAFSNRLFLPAFALMLPLAFHGFSLFCAAIFNKDFINSVLWIGSLVLFVLFMPWMTLNEYNYFSQAPVWGQQLRTQVVTWLNHNADAGDRVVLGDAGLIPYFSPLPFIDSYCLNNRTMAHNSEVLRYKQFCQQVMHDKPEHIILTSLIEKGKIIYTPSDSCLKKELNNHKGYKLIDKFTSDHSGSIYRYELFTKTS